MVSKEKIKAMSVITQEFKQLERSPLINFGITVGLVNEDNVFHWKGTILGPKDTCYQNGLFHLKIDFPDDYPNSKPEIIFLTPIYHLNVKYFVENSQPLGHICVKSYCHTEPIVFEAHNFLVDRRGSDPLILACKASVFPIELTAHLIIFYNKLFLLIPENVLTNF